MSRQASLTAPAVAAFVDKVVALNPSNRRWDQRAAHGAANRELMTELNAAHHR